MNIVTPKPLKRIPLEPLDPYASLASGDPVPSFLTKPDAETAASLERIRERLDEALNEEPPIAPPVDPVAEIRAALLKLTYGEMMDIATQLDAIPNDGDGPTQIAAWIHTWATHGISK